MTVLHWLGDAIRSSLMAIPLPLVRGVFVLLLCAVLVWVLLLPRDEAVPPDRPPRFGENLKLWASLALLLQILLYALV